MALWGAEVKPGQEYVHKLSQSHGRLRITRATLGNSNILSCSALKASVGHEDQLKLCLLHPIKMPTCSLELELEEDKNVTFSVDGQSSIYLSGYYTLNNPETCTVPRYLKGTHQEMPDRSRNNKKARREDVMQASGQTVPEKCVEDGKLRHDTNHESDDEEWNDGTQRTKATPPPTLHSNKNKAVKKYSGTLTISDSGIQHISDTDDEKQIILRAEKEHVLKIEYTTKGHPDAEVAALGSKVKVKFVGSFMNGEVFDEGESYRFQLGAGKVIPGWEQGIRDMLVGEERKLIIPPCLGYGGVKQDNIPPNSWLVYKIKLLEVE